MYIMWLLCQIMSISYLNYSKKTNKSQLICRKNSNNLKEADAFLPVQNRKI